MHLDEIAYRTLRALALQLPVIAVCLGGGVLMAIRYRRLGPGAVLVLIGCGLAVVVSVTFPALWVILQVTLRNQPPSVSTPAMNAAGIAHSLMWAAALLFLFMGIARTCSSRGPPSRRDT